MLHHLSLGVTDLKRSARFYDATLKALGYKRVLTSKWQIGWGALEGADKFAIRPLKGEPAITGPAFHLAFAAPSRKAADAFHATALKHGGRDNGGTGLHLEYGPNYYAAFVFDPDGYRIEATINKPFKP